MKLSINDILFTRDGRKIGNAIVVGVIDSWWTYTVAIITDYGTRFTLTSGELKELFFSKTRKADSTHKHFQKV